MKKHRICNTKGKRILSERAAKAEAGSRRTKQVHTMAYLCRSCGYWHIGKEFDSSRELTTLPVLGSVVIKHFKGD